MEKKSTRTASIAETTGGKGKSTPRRGFFPSLLRNPLFPSLLQFGAAAVLIAFIAAGWGSHAITGVEVTGPLIYTNLATVGFWVIWLMGLVLLLPFLGRVWCTVCPVGGCNDLTARLGLKRTYPRPLQNYALMAAFLLLFTAGSELFSLNRYPDYTAMLLLGVIAAAITAGLVFKGRIFCRYWCPVGGIIGLYSRLSPLEIGSRDQEVCRGCESKACYLGGTRWYRLSWSGWHTLFPFRRPGCPAAVFPPEAANNPACLMCTQCFKTCPYDNLRWGRRRSGGLRRDSYRDRSEALLLIVLTGIVVFRLARFAAPLREVLEWPAMKVSSFFPALSLTAAKGVNFLFGFALWPLVFYLVLAGLAKIASEVSLTSWPADGDRTSGLFYDMAEIDEERRQQESGWASRRHSLWGYISAFGYAFIPMIAGAFAAFALVKLNEKAGYLPLALADPVGVRTYLSISKLHLMAAPESLVSLTSLRWGVLAAAVAGVLFSFLSVPAVGARVYGEGSPAARRGAFVFRFGVLFLGGMILYSIRVWLFRGGM